jgi:hypothetical protein
MVDNPGRQLAAMRKIVSGNCEHCGRHFRGTKKRKYCLEEYNLAAYRHQQSGGKGFDSNGHITLWRE